MYGKSVTRTFWKHFLGIHTVQMVPKYIWMQHCNNLSVCKVKFWCSGWSFPVACSSSHLDITHFKQYMFKNSQDK